MSEEGAVSAPDVPDTNVRIAYLTGEYPRASMTFVLREVAALRRQGLDTITCAVRRTGPADLIGPEEEDAARETFYVLARARNPLALLADHAAALAAAPGRYMRAAALAARTARPGLRGALWQAFYFVEAAVLARHLRRQGATHLHNHFATSSASLAMIASEMSGLPYSFTLHGPADLFDPRGWRLDEKVARARFVVCISRFARSQAMLWSDRRHWPKLHVIHCGVELHRYGGGVPRAPGTGLELLFVGRLVGVKGLFVLLEALALLGRRDLRLTLVGDGADRAALEAEARRLGIAARFLGYRSQSEVADALRGADALVLPSFAEGVPVVLMEAAASGLPVVATRVAGVEELVRDGESGIVVPPGDAAALAGALERLADMTPEMRGRMGRAGRTIVAAGFDLDVEASKLAALFRPDGPDGGKTLPPPILGSARSGRAETGGV
ncbi:MAG: glycosyltransferase [Paracoccaceae bacterium]|jgi:glycosyltransferase involved in cell wall biosynthesis|nr:glycosyltransferase [Paracoccaceae bacterium]